jgi:hypothetical protein
VLWQKWLTGLVVTNWPTVAQSESIGQMWREITSPPVSSSVARSLPCCAAEDGVR